MSGYPSPQSDPAVARLSAQVEGIGREIRELRKVAEKTLAEQKRTNGRVTDLEMREVRRDATAEADARHDRDERKDKRTSESRRWEVRLAVIGAVIGLISAIVTAGVFAYLTPVIPQP